MFFNKCLLIFWAEKTDCRSVVSIARANTSPTSNHFLDSYRVGTSFVIFQKKSHSFKWPFQFKTKSIIA